MISLELVGTSETLEFKSFILQTETRGLVTMKTNFYQDLGGGEKAPSLLYYPCHSALLAKLPLHLLYCLCPQLGSLGEWRQEEQRMRENKQRRS